MAGFAVCQSGITTKRGLFATMPIPAAIKISYLSGIVKNNITWLFLFVFIAPVAAQQPAKIVFAPTTFYHSFTSDCEPALSIRSGDTVETETIDAMGVDKHGVRRARGGNPLTGPFVIEGAQPGDILAVKLIEVSLNRDYAKTSDVFVSRSMPKEIMRNFKKSRLVKWNIDRQTNMAWIDSAASRFPQLTEFKVSVSPMLGCIGVAPAGNKKGILSFFQGPYGGNLDYNRVRTGSTVYLPVFQNGAYLFVGDGHAIQGDGEIAGNALETSMNVRFCVQVLKIDSLVLSDPRVEDPEYIMALGTAKEVQDALKNASRNLLDWIRRDYHLDLSEATQVLSTSVEYSIAEIADPNVVVVARMRKAILSSLKK